MTLTMPHPSMILPLDTAVKRDTFIDAMARIPGPVSVITTGSGDARKGMTASALCSLSAEPPSVLVCINKTASAYEDLIAAGRFGMNIIDVANKEVAKAFAQKGVDRFSVGDWYQSQNDVPLLRGAPVALACRIAEVIDGFSHSIIMGEVLSLSLEDKALESASVVWLERGFRPVL